MTHHRSDRENDQDTDKIAAEREKAEVERTEAEAEEGKRGQRKRGITVERGALVAEGFGLELWVLYRSTEPFEVVCSDRRILPIQSCTHTTYRFAPTIYVLHTQIYCCTHTQTAVQF